jgi:hypothetical protein
MEGIAKVPSIFYFQFHPTVFTVLQLLHKSITVFIFNFCSKIATFFEVPMTTQSPQTLVCNWRDLYTAALFETDRSRVPNRIADAEKAIVARARELFSAGADTIEEDQALDDALYALRALQNCLQFRAAA